jgi:Flp pilus assembly pilin Flp
MRTRTAVNEEEHMPFENKQAKLCQRGQSFLEYALLLVFIAAIIIGALIITGRLTGSALNIFGETTPAATANQMGTLSSTENASQTETSAVTSTTVPAPTPTPAPASPAAAVQDLFGLINDYYAKHSSYPNSFADLGLDSSASTQLVVGVAINPQGSVVQFTNITGDSHQLYVQKLNGAMVQVKDGSAITCDIAANLCYLKTTAYGNQVDINSIVVTN